MADREKTIRGLGCIAGEYDMESNKCTGCGYRKSATYAICIAEIARDAIELLKAQEPAHVQYRKMNIGKWALTVCGNCKEQLREDWKYCPICGKAVKWE